MADTPKPKNLFPHALAQNPAPVELDSQDRKDKIRAQVDLIMETFLQILPSNYVSKVTGPFYTLQFQAAVERLAEFQVTAQEAFYDNSHEYTRPEFLFQVLGRLVFPDAHTDGYPLLHGDLTYREFLHKMVLLLLQGSKKTTIEGGLALLTDATIEVLERGILARDLGAGAGWGTEDQHTLEVNVSKIVEGLNGSTRYGFPDDPFVLQENVRLVLRALKPAHVLYVYRHLFRETFGAVFRDAPSFNFSSYYYADFRKFCLGAKNITGSTGRTLQDRTLFSDPSCSFSSIYPGAILYVDSGPNRGQYRVLDVLSLPFANDPIPRAYTTSGGLTGTVTTQGGVFTDSNQDFGQAAEGEQLTISSGPNSGTYRLQTLLGNKGGPVGTALGPATSVRPAPTLLRVHVRMMQAVSGQTYRVEVDRLGVRTPQTVAGEDATLYFIR